MSEVLLKDIKDNLSISATESGKSRITTPPRIVDAGIYTDTTKNNVYIKIDFRHPLYEYYGTGYSSYWDNNRDHDIVVTYSDNSQYNEYTRTALSGHPPGSTLIINIPSEKSGLSIIKFGSGSSNRFTIGLYFTDVNFDLKIYNSLFIALNRSIFIDRNWFWIPPNLSLKINGAKKEYANGWCKIDGQPREIDKIWIKVDGQAREV